VGQVIRDVREDIKRREEKENGSLERMGYLKMMVGARTSYSGCQAGYRRLLTLIA
jgi:hypothetical protein